jgi:hypothetical protein
VNLSVEGEGAGLLIRLVYDSIVLDLVEGGQLMGPLVVVQELQVVAA